MWCWLHNSRVLRRSPGESSRFPYGFTDVCHVVLWCALLLHRGQVCECVVILKNLKDVSWAGAKAMMTDPGFLKSLVEFDKDGLTDKQVKRVKTDYMKDPNFTYENIRNASTAGAGESPQSALHVAAVNLLCAACHDLDSISAAHPPVFEATACTHTPTPTRCPLCAQAC